MSEHAPSGARPALLLRFPARLSIGHGGAARWLLNGTLVAWPGGHPQLRGGGRWLSHAIMAGVDILLVLILARHLSTSMLVPIVLALLLSSVWIVEQPLKVFHVLWRDADGNLRFERQWDLAGKVVLRRREIPLADYQWSRVVNGFPLWSMRLELGNSRYLTFRLAEFNSGSRKVPLSDENAAAAREALLTLAARMTELAGIENRGFREHH